MKIISNPQRLRLSPKLSQFPFTPLLHIHLAGPILEMFFGWWNSRHIMALAYTTKMDLMKLCGIEEYSSAMYIFVFELRRPVSKWAKDEDEEIFEKFLSRVNIVIFTVYLLLLLFLFFFVFFLLMLRKSNKKRSDWRKNEEYALERKKTNSSYIRKEEKKTDIQVKSEMKMGVVEYRLVARAEGSSCRGSK